MSDKLTHDTFSLLSCSLAIITIIYAFYLIICSFSISFFRSEYESIVLSQERLEAYVGERMPDFHIKKVQGDGLCILRSFQECLRSHGEYYPIEKLLESLRSEMLREHAFYKEFAASHINILEELDNFLKEPLQYYNSDTCDTFLMALGNALKCKTVIFQASAESCWTVNMYNDQNDFQKTLYFARSISDHFDAVVKKATEDSDIEIVKVVEGTKEMFDGRYHVKEEPKDIYEGICILFESKLFSYLIIIY